MNFLAELNINSYLQYLSNYEYNNYFSVTV